MSFRANHEMQAVDLSHLGSLHPEEVLYDFDGPCIFTTRAPSKALLLAYLCEDLEADECLRYIVATTSSEIVRELKQGLVSIRQALTSGSMWLIDFDYAMHPRHAFAVALEDLPGDALPAEGTMLFAHLEPALRVRFAGDAVQPGKIPASAILQAGDVASKALKSVIEWAARITTSGRPPEWLRALYHLPMQRLAYGSLDIGFSAPEIPRGAQQLSLLSGLSPEARSPEDLADEGWRLFRKGLEWATSTSAEIQAESDEERLAILEALRHLAPASTGPITDVLVSGSKIGRLERPYRLDRDVSKKIRRTLTALKSQRDVQLRVFSGRVRSLDLDTLVFVLRDVPDEVAEIPFVLEDERLLETAREAFNQELEIKVAGRSTDSKTWTAVELEFATGSIDPPSDRHD